MKTLLWLSLILLTATYSVLGYFLAHWTLPWVVWLLVVVLSLGQAVLMTQTSKQAQDSVWQWMGSDTGTLTVITLVALSLASVLVWFNVSQFLLLVAATELLARVELRHSGISSAQSLGVLTGISLLGLGLGWTLSGWV